MTPYQSEANKLLTDGKQEVPPEPKPPRELKYMDYDLLMERCHQPIESFKIEGEVTETKDGIYIYKNNGSNVLAVAHLDVVQYVRNNKKFSVDGNIITATQFDDRLGVYIILDLLPQFGINVDILLTENEEVGRSTAQHFTMPEGREPYHYMVEFDRMGLDPTMYEYETDEYKEWLKKYGFNLCRGTNTDIRYLDFLGIAGINFGIAYYNQHTDKSYCNTEELEEQILPKVVKFLQENVDHKTVYVPKPKVTYNNYVSGGSGYDYYSYKDDNEDWRTWVYGGGKQPDKNIEKARYTSTNNRFVYDNQDKLVVCPECHLPPVKCNSLYVCVNKPKVTGCELCRVKDCSGYNHCIDCGFWFHNNIYIRTFNTCYNCLSRYGIDDLYLYVVKSGSGEVKKSAIEFIDKAIQDYDEKHIINNKENNNE